MTKRLKAQPVGSPVDIKEWKKALKHHRREKQAFFRSSPQSPAPGAKLRFYKADPRLRITAAVRKEELRSVRLQRSTGDTAEYVRIGTAAFSLGGAPARLALYRSELDGHLFVPFKDGTNGTETYGAGRYLEAFYVAGDALLDFNYAYQPYCAYNEAYACPVPPMENHLRQPIRAGQRL